MVREKNWWFGAGGSTSAAGDLGLLALRVVAMLLLITLHGLGKVPPDEQFAGWIGSMGFPAPMLFAWMAGLTEVVVAALILVGLLTRPAGLFMFVYFMIVVLVAHAGDPLGDRELPLMFAMVGLAVGLTGAGRYSVDAMIRGRRASEPAARPAP